MRRLLTGLFLLCLATQTYAADPVRGVFDYRMLCTSGVAVTAPADTNENTLATCTISPGILGINGSLKVRAIWSNTNNVNNKSYIVRLGGAGGTLYSFTLASQTNVVLEVWIFARGATNSQVGMTRITTGSTSVIGSVTTGAIDMTASQTILIRGTKAVGGDTLTLESYSIEMYQAN